MDILNYILTFTEGLLSFISPCILPMLPVYFLYLAGNVENSNNGQAIFKARLVINSIGFVVGFSIVFVVLGATVTALGRFLAANRDVLRMTSGVAMMLFGLYFTGIFKLAFLNTEKRFTVNTNKLHFPGSVLFGMAFGFGWTPCLGVFLGSALALAGNSGSIAEGILLLLSYSIGLGVPFIMSSIVFEKTRSIFRKIQACSSQISMASGLLLFAAGILVFFNLLK